MNIEELEDFALHELKRQRNCNDIILGLCQRAGWDWKQAQHFLDEVYADHHSELTARKKRLALLFNLTLMIDGLLVLAVGSIGILGPFFYNLRAGKFMIPTVDYPIIPTVLMTLFISPAYFGFFIVIASIGIGMTAKGILGLVHLELVVPA